MRKASNDYDFIVKDSIFYGISLGYDFTSEHEWGIKRMRQLFGIPDTSKENMGIKSRAITQIPDFEYDKLIFKKETQKIDNKEIKGAILYVGEEKYIPSDLKDYHKKINSDNKYIKEHSDIKMKPGLITAWDERSFGVAVIGEKQVKYLRELYLAFKQNNVAITSLGSSNPFSNTSLGLFIVDRLPQEVLDSMYKADKKYFDREDYEKEIGMKKLKKKMVGGYKELHYFMACSPKWIDYDDKKAREKYKKKNNTKYDIIYWINYSDNDDYYGWHTVEEIRTWLTGDVPLKQVVKKMRKKEK